MGGQPSGTVTFLFSDIEGSTRLLDELGAERYADVLEQHRRLLREAFRAHDGFEVECEGDELFVAFQSAREAVAAAAEAQGALAAGPARVRIGLHTGEALLAPPQYVGLDVHKAARVMAAAHGGQVLLSQATRSLVEEPALFRDLGEHRLKDLATPVRLYQIGDRVFPPLRSLYRTNLPVPATPFLGRQSELAEVTGLLEREDVRLLTLTGLHVCEVDVTNKRSVETMIDEVVTAHGGVDILVNSAGTAARHPAEDFPEDEYDRIIALNLKGSFLAAQAAGRQMIAQGRGGAIINIASIGASIVYPHATAYNQSKGGVVQMTRSLALEWIGHGIRVNAIAPTLFDTPLVKAADAKRSITSEFIMARQLIDRRGAPYEVAGPAVFLASRAASMITGHMLQVDAGYVIA